MKLTLSGALHARPASLFVRVASTFLAVVEVRKGERRADAKNILEVLSLGAGCGDVIEFAATGEDAEAALAALRTLIERNFDADLVPETGAAAASGIAVGPALVLEASDRAREAGADENGATSALPSDPEERRARLERALGQVRGDLETLVRALPAAEAALFEPELLLVQALAAPLTARIVSGESIDRALSDVLFGANVTGALATSDLLLDARDRLLGAWDPTRSSIAQRLTAGPPGDVVLVAHELTPSMVAALPRRVTGIVAAWEDVEESAPGAGYASHAAILARGRGLPLVFVAPHVAHTIETGDTIVVDVRETPARVWTAPSEARVAEARAACAEESRRRREAETSGAPSLDHLRAHGGVPVAVRANVGSMHDFVPLASDGVGLVRTELLHAASACAPSLEEQVTMLALVVGKAPAGPVVVRLFDGGGDKPIAWLPAPADAAGARGIELLARHPQVLSTQVEAVARAAAHADVRILLPLARGAADVALVRALAPGIPVGAMIETPEAARASAEIAAASDFVCIGTNDLTAAVRGEDRAHAVAAPLDPRVLALIADIVAAAHAAGKSVTVCGEMAGDLAGAKVLVGLGVDAISVAPARLVAIRSGLAAASAAACSDVSQRAMNKGDEP